MEILKKLGKHLDAFVSLGEYFGIVQNVIQITCRRTKFCDHELIQTAREGDWYCDKCGSIFKSIAGLRWHCTEGCDFDLCQQCKEDIEGKRREKEAGVQEKARKLEAARFLDEQEAAEIQRKMAADRALVDLEAAEVTRRQDDARERTEKPGHTGKHKNKEGEDPHPEGTSLEAEATHAGTKAHSEISAVEDAQIEFRALQDMRVRPAETVDAQVATGSNQNRADLVCLSTYSGLAEDVRLDFGDDLPPPGTIEVRASCSSHCSQPSMEYGLSFQPGLSGEQVADMEFMKTCISGIEDGAQTPTMSDSSTVQNGDIKKDRKSKKHPKKRHSHHRKQPLKPKQGSMLVHVVKESSLCSEEKVKMQPNATEKE